MQLKRLKKLSEEIIHENPWTAYKHDRYEKPTGAEGDYYYLETPGAVVIIPQLPDGRIVMTLQYRYLNDKQSIAFVCGGIKKGMDTLDAAKLELQEETGCVGDNWVKVGVFEPSAGCIKDPTHVFTTHVVEQREQQLDDTEQIDLLFRRPEEVDEMMVRGDVWCGQSIASWMLARHHFPSHNPPT
jgi:ADP-ribose pyrophosphatase